MITVNKLLPQGRGLSPVLLKRAASIEIDWDTRQKSRFDALDSQGRALGVFLPRGTAVRGGDVLVAEDGSLVKVIAQPQAVMRVLSSAEHGSPFDLLRASYHLGNRHVPIELTPDHLQIEPDHVLAGMLRQMHLTVTELMAPFEPEGGAYSSHAGHDRAHDHDHAHPHDHAPERADHAHLPQPAPVAAPTHGHDHVGHGGHEHGPGCNHDH